MFDKMFLSEGEGIGVLVKSRKILGAVCFVECGLYRVDKFLLLFVFYFLLNL